MLNTHKVLHIILASSHPQKTVLTPVKQNVKPQGCHKDNLKAKYPLRKKAFQNNHPESSCIGNQGIKKSYFSVFSQIISIQTFTRAHCQKNDKMFTYYEKSYNFVLHVDSIAPPISEPSFWSPFGNTHLVILLMFPHVTLKLRLFWKRQQTDLAFVEAWYLTVIIKVIII